MTCTVLWTETFGAENYGVVGDIFYRGYLLVRRRLLVCFLASRWDR
jgi:hypothetical protein